MKRLALALLLVALAAPASASALPSRYILPGPQAFPEGVTTQPGTDNFFVSSTASGAIFRGNLGRAKTKVFLAPGGQGRTHATGLKATRDRLVVAGSAPASSSSTTCPAGSWCAASTPARAASSTT